MREPVKAFSPLKTANRPNKRREPNVFVEDQKRLYTSSMKCLDENYEQYWCRNDINRELVYSEYRRNADRNAEDWQPKSGGVLVCGSQDCNQLGTACAMGGSLKRFKRLKLRSDVVHVAAGSLTSFFLTKDGKLFSFGSSDLGALGRRTDTNNDETVEMRPIQVKGFNPSKNALVQVKASNEDESIMQVSAGASHCLVLTNRGSVYQFGCYADSENNAWREMPPADFPDTDDTGTELYKGAAPRGYREEPRHLHMMPQKVQRVFTGGSMSAVLLQDSTILTWGIDACGELGQNNNEHKRDVLKTIKQASGDARAEDISDEERRKHQNTVDRCLQKIKEDFLKPKKVVYDPPLGQHFVLDVACGANHMLVVVRHSGSAESMVYATGLNNYGQLGLGHENNIQKLTLIPDSKNKFITKVAAGTHHSIFLNLSGNAIWTCGRADYGQLGISDRVPACGHLENRMKKLAFDKNDDLIDLNFHSISAGDHQSHAVSRSGKLYCWGFNVMGALGHGNEVDEPRPTVVKKFNDDKSGIILEAFGGSQHTIVLAQRNN